LKLCTTETNTKAFAFLKQGDEFIPHNISFNFFMESNMNFMLPLYYVKRNAFSFQRKINELEIHPTAVIMPFFL